MPPPGRVLVRCIWDPTSPAKRSLPDAIQTVMDERFPRGDAANLAKEMADRDLKARRVIADFPSCKKALEASVLAGRFKQLAWQLTSVAEDFRFETATFCFAGIEERHSYNMTITFGPRGTLLQLDMREP